LLSRCFTAFYRKIFGRKSATKRPFLRTKEQQILRRALMFRIFTRFIPFLVLFILFILPGAFAQTITIGNVNPGPYTPGSSISVPFNINDASGCIQQNNTFNVYLSDATGNFAPGTVIGTYNGFYASFINCTIPNGTLPGAGYKIIVKSTNPAVPSAASNAFTVTAGLPVTAGASSQILTPAYPEVYGQCIGSAGAQFTFTNTSTAGTTVTATFFNELTQTAEQTNVPIPATGYVFTANTGNYTVTVTAKTATGDVSTHSYVLVNNVINTNIGSTGNLAV
jgi:hypothetical protein